MSNYPDDIRQYDNDYRSPFYEPQHRECEHRYCENVISEEDMDEDGRCSEECEIVRCTLCEDDELDCICTLDELEIDRLEKVIVELKVDINVASTLLEYTDEHKNWLIYLEEKEIKL